MLKNLGEDLLAQPENENRTETFEQCLKRLGITEAQLQKRMRSSLQIILFCLGLGVAIIIYAFYLWSQGMLMAGFTSLILGGLLGSYAFREHFNYFQMKKRQLGCSLKDWVKFMIGGGK